MPHIFEVFLHYRILFHSDFLGMYQYDYVTDLYLCIVLPGDKAKMINETRMLLLQATVKRFQLDLYVNLEGQQMLISSWLQK